ncbi:MAG: DNA adenine methylase [Methanobacterium sp.]
MTPINEIQKEAKPFLKWAGGKNQLLIEFNKILPPQILENKKIETYIEPFVGGGAMFFFLRNNYDIKNSILIDINQELILGYKVIQNDYKELINELRDLEDIYNAKSEENRKEYYYKIRSVYNRQMNNFDYINYNNEWIIRVAYLIFLNKTGFNGLFRQNSKGEFNVPQGRYKNPKICDEENIIQVNQALKDTMIICNDFTIAENYINKDTFIYLDPPYRPLNKTSNFTSYSKTGFTDKDQKKLTEFYKKMALKGAFLMLSNSDPKNNDPTDEFFDELYKGFNIKRVPAKRIINCNASKRGELNEIIIRNY